MQVQVILWKGQLSDTHYQYNYVYISCTAELVDNESELITQTWRITNSEIIQALLVVGNHETVQQHGNNIRFLSIRAEGLSF